MSLCFTDIHGPRSALHVVQRPLCGDYNLREPSGAKTVEYRLRPSAVVASQPCSARLTTAREVIMERYMEREIPHEEPARTCSPNQLARLELCLKPPCLEA